MAAYGGIQANQADVVFPLDKALPAARDLWSLAGKLEAHQSARGTKAVHARIDWCGPHHDTFELHVSDEETDTGTTATGLKKLATTIASQWAQCRGEQDRRNWASWVDSDIEDDSGWENVGEFFVGEDDYGDPPGNPAAPTGPDFAEPDRSGLRDFSKWSSFGP